MNPATSRGTSCAFRHNWKSIPNSHPTIHPIQPPPRYLLGASLVFWGVMTDRVLSGLLLAIIVEGAHFLKFRWEFNSESASKAWQITTVGIAITTALIFLDDAPYLALPNLLTWLPPLLLPLQFVQSFGLRDSIPLSTFSFLAKHRHKRNLRLGLPEQTIHINFGNIYFVAILVSATLGSRSNAMPYSMLFLPGIVVLTGWRLLCASQSRKRSLVIALFVAGCISLAGQVGLNHLVDSFGNRGPGGSPFNPNSVFTMIGRPGKVELSPDIVWRLSLLGEAPRPTLLRTATYGMFHGSTWVNQRLVEFRDLNSIEPEKGNIFYLLGEDTAPKIQRESISPGLPRFSLRGTAFAETPLPLPGDTASLQEFELDDVEINPLGTVRVFPKRSVISGTVLWNGPTTPDSAPYVKEDLAIPNIERENISSVVREIGLDREATLEGKLSLLRAWFRQNFTYSTSLSISSSNYRLAYRTAISQFLSTNRSGHCEYFATAAALLLREVGIPVRYAIGYAVVELDPKRGEFVIRGTHGHSWCRVWDEQGGRWIDFDVTPPSWLATSPPANTFAQKFSDAQKRIREDFSLWRNQPANRLAASLVMLTIALGVFGFITMRLWRSKQRLEAVEMTTGYGGPVVRTPLNAIENVVEKRLGSRPPGQSFATWLMRLHPSLPDSRALEEAIELHQRLRFDPVAPQPSQQQRLSDLANQLSKAIQRC
ncbi:MAG: transglutaminase-like domain-containing protein [Luteolibacter sp.]